MPYSPSGRTFHRIAPLYVMDLCPRELLTEWEWRSSSAWITLRSAKRCNRAFIQWPSALDKRTTYQVVGAALSFMRFLFGSFWGEMYEISNGKWCRYDCCRCRMTSSDSAVHTVLRRCRRYALCTECRSSIVLKIFWTDHYLDKLSSTCHRGVPVSMSQH